VNHAIEFYPAHHEAAAERHWSALRDFYGARL